VRGFLLDTNVLSELRKATRNESVVTFANSQPRPTLYTCDINFAEIQFGIDRQTDAQKRKQFQDWLDNMLRPWFGSNVVPVSEAAVLAWRHIVEGQRKRGFTGPEPDTLLAAVAQTHDLVVVSRDVVPFRAAPIPVFDPWNGHFYRDGGEEPFAVDAGEPDLLQRLTGMNAIN
jgi:toxin FitB